MNEARHRQLAAERVVNTSCVGGAQLLQSPQSLSLTIALTETCASYSCHDTQANEDPGVKKLSTTLAVSISVRS